MNGRCSHGLEPEIPCPWCEDRRSRGPDIRVAWSEYRADAAGWIRRAEAARAHLLVHQDGAPTNVNMAIPYSGLLDPSDDEIELVRARYERDAMRAAIYAAGAHLVTHTGSGGVLAALECLRPFAEGELDPATMAQAELRMQLGRARGALRGVIAFLSGYAAKLFASVAIDMAQRGLDDPNDGWEAAYAAASLAQRIALARETIRDAYLNNDDPRDTLECVRKTLEG